jgi:hypothetical protein
MSPLIDEGRASYNESFLDDPASSNRIHARESRAVHISHRRPPSDNRPIDRDEQSTVRIRGSDCCCIVFLQARQPSGIGRLNLGSSAGEDRGGVDTSACGRDLRNDRTSR